MRASPGGAFAFNQPIIAHAERGKASSAAHFTIAAEMRDGTQDRGCEGKPCGERAQGERGIADVGKRLGGEDYDGAYRAA